MFKVAFAVFVGLVGAALLHLIILLSLPHFGNHDAYARAAAQGAPHRFHLLGRTGGKAGLGGGDPFVRLAVCTFDIGEKPVRLAAFGAVPFWSVAIYDRGSNEVFSMNDRTSAGGVLDILVADAAQLAAIRKAQPKALAQSILVETGVKQGYAVLRAMMPQQSFEEAARDFLEEAKCDPTPWR